eukprot:6487660-Amphidinium_carterae.1
MAWSTQAAVKSRLGWWQARAAVMGVDPYPLTEQMVRHAGALLKAGGYRSAKVYLYSMKKEHVKQGFLWTDALEVELRDGVRSCERGMGPPKKAKPMELGVLAAHGSLEPLVPGGPVLP